MTQTDIRLQSKTRIRQIASKLLDATERVLDTINTPSAERPPLAIVRRQAANTLALWQFCANDTCRRSRCCRGEPLHCLHSGLPLLPGDTIEGLMKKSRGKRSKRG